MTGVVRRLPRPDRAGHPAAPDRAPLVAVAVHGARRQGIGEGNTMSAPGGDRERRRGRARPRRRRAAADPAARLGAARTGDAVKPAAVRVRRRPVARGGARGARRRRGREGDRRRPEPRARPEHAPRAADAARRPQPRRARPGRARRRRSGSAPPCGRRRSPRSAHASARSREALPLRRPCVTRNRGTVGGSIAHADGAAELPLCLVALGGTVVAEGPDGRREIQAEEFFVTHYATTLAPGELVVETIWPRRGRATGSAFEELALRAGDFALAMAAVVRVGSTASHGRARASRRRHRPADARRRRGSVDGAPATTRRHGRRALAPPQPSTRRHRSTPRPDTCAQLTGMLVERALLRAWERAGMIEITLTVNGRAVAEHVEPRLLLSDFLRHRSASPAPTSAASTASAAPARCGSTASRCGPACLLAVQADGVEVDTVEGLAGDARCRRCRRPSASTTRSSAASARRGS